MSKNWSYTITDKSDKHYGKTLWSGRYCAISAFIFANIDSVWCVLANKRGKGTPDYQGKWNCPCGYLEADESAQEGCARETLEETGLKIPIEKFKMNGVETEPEICNNANVTIRHICIFNYEESKELPELNAEKVKSDKLGETNEVADVKWIPIGDISKYEWAFNQKETILNLIIDNIFMF